MIPRKSLYGSQDSDFTMLIRSRFETVAHGPRLWRTREHPTLSLPECNSRGTSRVTLKIFFFLGWSKTTKNPEHKASVEFLLFTMFGDCVG